MNWVNRILIDHGLKDYIDGFGYTEIDEDIADVAVANCIEEAINLSEVDEEEHPVAFYILGEAVEHANFGEIVTWYNNLSPDTEEEEEEEEEAEQEYPQPHPAVDLKLDAQGRVCPRSNILPLVVEMEKLKRGAIQRVADELGRPPQQAVSELQSRLIDQTHEWFDSAAAADYVNGLIALAEQTGVVVNNKPKEKRGE